MSDCVFCKIVAGDIPTEKVFEDENILAFPDIKPQAKVHVLIVPKKHIMGLPEATPDDKDVLGSMQLAIQRIAAELDIEDGYRVNLNAGHFQEVPHLHYHLLGGEKGGK